VFLEKKKIIIAIDGYAATGKSSQAKLLANFFNYTYIDSGAMYRAVTYYALHQNPKGEINFHLLLSSLGNIKIHFEYTDEGQQTFLNGKNISKNIRSVGVDNQVSNVASNADIRYFLVAQQKIMGIKKEIIMDGRDIGTVVFPSAECKFFLTASPEIRAKRRYDEQLKTGIKNSYKEVLQNVIIRDYQDTTREITPLKKAKDATAIDVSDLSLDEVFQILKTKIISKLKN
jgi:cytidylate kinase